jgi:hypothetical protein
MEALKAGLIGNFFSQNYKPCYGKKRETIRIFSKHYLSSSSILTPSEPNMNELFEGTKAFLGFGTCTAI